MEWDRDAAELGQHPVLFFFFFFMATSTEPFDLNERRVRVFGDTKGESGNRVSLHSSFRYRWIKLPLLPWPRPCVFLFLFPLSENWVVGRWKHGSRNFSKSGRKISGKENSVAMEYFVVRYEIFARVYGQVEHPYPCYIVSFNLDRDLKLYFFFF